MSAAGSNDEISARAPSPSPQSLRPGDLLGGRYELRRGLGSGGYSNVLEAFDRVAQRPVAIKLLKTDAGNNDPSANARMRQEASLLEGISHPNVVETYDYVVEGAMTYIVMEYIPGISLAHIIYNEGPAPMERVLPIAKQLLGALDACHRNGILHRDIKPENIILISSSDQNVREVAKLVDFGLAKPYIQSSDMSDTSDQITFVRTRAGGFLGTPRYTPPEQAVGDPIGPYTDIFALGLVLAEWLTGQVRLKGDTHAELMSNLVGPAPLETEDCPRPWQPFLKRLLVKDPKQRPQTAQEAIYELEETVELELSGQANPGEFEFDSARGTFVPSTNPGMLALDAKHVSFLDSDEPLELDLDAARATARPATPTPQPHHAPPQGMPPGPPPGAAQGPDSTAAIPMAPSRQSRMTRASRPQEDEGSLSIATALAVGLLSCIVVLFLLFALMLLRSALG